MHVHVGVHSTLLAFRTQEPLGGFQGPLMGLPRWSPAPLPSGAPPPAPPPGRALRAAASPCARGASAQSGRRSEWTRGRGTGCSGAPRSLSRAAG